MCNLKTFCKRFDLLQMLKLMFMKLKNFPDFQIILEDIKLLKLTPDMYTRTSDHFDSIFKYAEQLIKQGDAYCDCTPSEEMRKLREERQPSKYRNQGLYVWENHSLLIFFIIIFIIVVCRHYWPSKPSKVEYFYVIPSIVTLACHYQLSYQFEILDEISLINAKSPI